MIGITRGISTLLGAVVAGFLLWLAAQMGTGTSGEYWATYGLVAAAGLTMALSQLLGGWTKWGWPRVSLAVLLLGFLPVLLLGGWVLLARQPADFFNTSNWSRDLGVHGAVSDLGELLAAVAFAIGLTFGFTFDTAGPRRAVAGADGVRGRAPGRTAAGAPPAAGVGEAAAPGWTRPGDEAERAERPLERHDPPQQPRADDETVATERTEQVTRAEGDGERGRRFGLRRRDEPGGDG